MQAWWRHIALQLKLYLFHLAFFFPERHWHKWFGFHPQRSAVWLIRRVFTGSAPQTRVLAGLFKFICTGALKHKGNSKHFTKGIKSTIIQKILRRTEKGIRASDSWWTRESCCWSITWCWQKSNKKLFLISAEDFSLWSLLLHYTQVQMSLWSSVWCLMWI